MKKLIGFRKYLLALLLVVISMIALFLGFASFYEWAGFNSVIIGSYNAGNVGEYFGKRYGIKHEIETKIDNDEN